MAYIPRMGVRDLCHLRSGQHRLHPGSTRWPRQRFGQRTQPAQSTQATGRRSLLHGAGQNKGGSSASKDRDPRHVVSKVDVDSVTPSRGKCSAKQTVRCKPRDSEEGATRSKVKIKVTAERPARPRARPSSRRRRSTSAPRTKIERYGEDQLTAVGASSAFRRRRAPRSARRQPLQDHLSHQLGIVVGGDVTGSQAA